MDWKCRLHSLSRNELVAELDDAIRPEYLYADGAVTFGEALVDVVYHPLFNGFACAVDVRYQRRYAHAIAPFGVTARFVTSVSECGDEEVYDFYLSCMEAERAFGVLQMHHLAGKDACRSLGTYRRTKELTDLFYRKLSSDRLRCADIASVVEDKLNAFRSYPIEKINAEINDALVSISLNASETAQIIRLVRPIIRFLPEGKDRWDSRNNVGWWVAVREIIGENLPFPNDNSAIYWTVANAVYDVQNEADEFNNRSPWRYESEIFEALELAGYQEDAIDYVLQKMRPVTVFLSTRLI